MVFSQLKKELYFILIFFLSFCASCLPKSSLTSENKGNGNESTLKIEIQIDGKAPDGSSSQVDLMKAAQKTQLEIEEALKDEKFSGFLAANAPSLTTLIVDPTKTPFSDPPTVNGKHKSLTQLKSIIVHEGFAHWAIPDAADKNLIETFKKSFPNLDMSRLKKIMSNQALAEEISYRHVGVNVVEILAMQKIISPQELADFYTPQTISRQNPLRTPVYEEIYNLVIKPENLRLISEILQKNGVILPK